MLAKGTTSTATFSTAPSLQPVGALVRSSQGGSSEQACLRQMDGKMQS